MKHQFLFVEWFNIKDYLSH